MQQRASSGLTNKNGKGPVTAVTDNTGVLKKNEAYIGTAEH